jgi:DNA repair protein RadC
MFLMNGDINGSLTARSALETGFTNRVAAAQRTEQSTLTEARAALVRRRHRAKLFGELRVADGPAWEMLIDLYVSQLEGKSLCVGSLCVTSGVPMTSAARLLTKLLDTGLVRRVRDPDDRRRRLIALDDATCLKLDRYFSQT